jgi:hypothetical protein
MGQVKGPVVNDRMCKCGKPAAYRELYNTWVCYECNSVWLKFCSMWVRTDSILKGRKQ